MVGKQWNDRLLNWGQTQYWGFINLNAILGILAYEWFLTNQPKVRYSTHSIMCRCVG